MWAAPLSDCAAGEFLRSGREEFFEASDYHVS
jgi:hypothetical protein